MKPKKLLRRLLAGAVHNVSFQDFTTLIEDFGFEFKDIQGSHFTFRHPSIRVKLSVQNREGEAKSYQVRQFLKIVEKHNLQLKETADE